MNCIDFRDIFKAVVKIDYQSGKVLYANGIEPFTSINEITSIDALNKVLLTFTKEDVTPIYKQIELNGRKYWIWRKKVADTLYFFIKELPYIDFALKEVAHKSIIDGLTKCYNKVTIEKEIEQFLLRFLRYENSFSLLMFDIDFFKKVNDIYGHLAGDCVLEELAKLVKSLLRDSDVCGRFGGEEFLVLLPETRVAGGMRLAKRINQACKEHSFVYKQQNIEVRISVGVTAPTKIDSVASLIDRCDDALYDAKKNGRDRVEYR